MPKPGSFVKLTNMQLKIEKTYEPKKYESDIYNKWENSGFFNPDNLDLEKDSPAYSIIMPPPNVTGVLHMGHAAMLAFEDILIRYHRLNGYRTLWIPGTDHAAIATQAKVESLLLKEEGKTKYDLGRENFLSKVRKYAQNCHDRIEGQIKKMGSSCDWSREAYTLDEIRTRAVRSVFKMMYEDGLIYQGERIVNWCPRCRSTLSDDEVEYKTQNAKFYTFKYSSDFPLAISTTRPETKLADTAVAVNPKDKRYKDYIGKTYEVDFVGVPLKIKIVADRSIDPEFGTGALGVTPAHSATDWDLAREHDLEIVKAINEEGKIKEGYGEFSDKKVEEVRERVVAKLKEKGLLEKEEEIENNLSICYRCDTPVEPLPSLQWFIDVNKKVPKLGKTLKEACREAVEKGFGEREKINIFPPRFEKNYYHWIDNLRDWCISRQIWFGHRIPVWYKSDNTKHKTPNKDQEVYVGVEAPTEKGWKQDEDTLDTWFSSGLWTFSTMAHSPEEISLENGKLKIDSPDFKNYHPTAVLETGYDILFFWVARMILMTTYVLEDIPFQDVYLHGLVLDAEGKKMSKSKGNVIDPMDMAEKYGTDATRLSLIMHTTPGADIKSSEEKVAGFRNLVNKLWNISRYILSNYEKKEEKSKLEFNKLSLADQWIIQELVNTIKTVEQHLINYNFSQAGEVLREFTRNYLADWYVEASKFEESEQKNEVMFCLLENLLKLWHPFIPFVTEAIWQKFNPSDLIVDKWPDISDLNEIWLKYSETGTGQDFEIIKEIISSIRNARSENKVEPGQKIKAVISAGSKKDLLEKNSQLLKGMRTGVKELEIQEKIKPEGDFIYAVSGEVEIYLLGAVDKEKEEARIKKELDKLENFIKILENKLNNRSFRDNASSEVVAGEEEKMTKAREEAKALKEKLENL